MLTLGQLSTLYLPPQMFPSEPGNNILISLNSFRLPLTGLERFYAHTKASAAESFAVLFLLISF